MTVYFTVPLPVILCIPNPSTCPSLALKDMKSSLQNEIVKEHLESKIISTASLSKCMCEFESLAMCAPRNIFRVATIDVSSICLRTLGSYVCLIYGKIMYLKI